AKSFYYSLLINGLKFDSEKLLNFIIKGSYDTNFFTEKYAFFDGMYRNALRADAFQDEYPELNSNRLLVLLYETMEGRRNSKLILEDLKKIDYERVTPDVRLIHTWLSFISATSSGNIEDLESIFEKNKSFGKEGGIEISDREFLFLKGLAAYKSKDYIKSLELLRDCKEGLDFISINAIKTEAMIFYYQNLHEKSITILEKLYVDLNGEDQSIKVTIQEIVSSKSGLKSKLL
ncbi:MAG: hypothetical protein KDK36_20850, partial [Leptospiraceae bacterium]|nr:hypothetical protein [Leptospiraceae bacterium]